MEINELIVLLEKFRSEGISRVTILRKDGSIFECEDDFTTSYCFEDDCIILVPSYL